MNWKLPKWLYPGLRIKRWLVLLLVGVTMIGLGIAYILVELYKHIQLPPVFYYLTLQFLNQTVRGSLFMTIGILLIISGLKQLFQSIASAFLPNKNASLFNIVYEQRGPSKKPRIVVFANGMGLFILLSAIQDIASQIDVVLPMGEDKDSYTKLISLNHIVLHQVFISMVPNAVICAEYNDSSIEKGLLTIKESRRRGYKIKRMFLESDGDKELSDECIYNKEVIDSIRDADYILFGPSSLHVGIAPALLSNNVSNAISESRAQKIFICNIMTESGKTEGYSVSEHVKFLETVGHFDLNYVILNNKRVRFDLWEKYSAYGASQVLLDLDEFENTFIKIDLSHVSGEVRMLNKATLIEGDLIDAVAQYDMVNSNIVDESVQHKFVVRHDAEKLRGILSKLLIKN